MVPPKNNQRKSAEKKLKAEPITIKLLLPVNLNLEDILPAKSIKKLHHYHYFCHTIIHCRINQKKVNDNSYLPLDSRILQKMLTTKEQAIVIKDLKEYGIIEVNENYVIGTAKKAGKCKGYRFTENYQDKGLKEVEIFNNPLIKKIRKLEERKGQLSINQEDKTLNYLRNQLSRLGIDLFSGYEYVLKPLSSKISPEFKDKSGQTPLKDGLYSDYWNI